MPGETQSVGEFLKSRIESFKYVPQIYEYGTVESCADDIVHIKGLPRCRYNELLEFPGPEYGIAMDLEERGVGAVLLSKYSELAPGDTVRQTGRVVTVPTGDGMIGRVVDPIGRPLDGGPAADTDEFRPLESPAPTIMQRSAVDTPLLTGILAVDSMIPIGRGQRELIIGDRQTGKTTMAVSAVLNQKDEDVICVYCAIGQKASTVADVIRKLREGGAMGYTVVVASTADDCAAMQYLTPYAGCAVAEGFMYSGKDVLIVYDDLSKHAVAYRSMSLLLRRPSGREAYPGDVFYLHSRLLERAAKLSEEAGGGSLTALPIVETMSGDISAYIPTNVISITDGQIYLESELFNAGIRPAVNVGLSVSRVGRNAQHAAMKAVSGNLRLDLAEYRDMSVFARFGADIDDATAVLLRRGEKLTEILKQNGDTRYSLSEQTALLLAYGDDAFSDVPNDKIAGVCALLLYFLHEDLKDAMLTVDSTGMLTDATRELFSDKIREFFEKGAAESAKRT